MRQLEAQREAGAKSPATPSGRAALVGLLPLLLIALFVALALYGQRPPAVVAEGAPPGEFSAERAMRHVTNVSRRPHPSGSEAHAQVREYISKELSALGLDAQVQKTTALNLDWGNPFRAGLVQNVVARQKGTGGGRALMLAAHYDSAATSFGASDDGAAVAALLETARALKAAGPLKHDVIYLFTDGEELGLLGARGFVEGHPWAKDIGFVLNFEARGTAGPSIMFETSDGNARAVSGFADASPYPVANSLSHEVYKRLPNDTDFTVFREAGMSGLNFAFIERLPRYHTLLDTADNLDPRSLQHHGSNALALARHLGNSGLEETPSANAVYFDLLGSVLVNYPGALVVPLAVAAVLLFAVTTFLGLRRGRLRLSRVMLGAGLFLLSVVVAAVTMTALWWLIRTLQGALPSLPQGYVYNSNLFMIGFAAVAVAVVAALCALFGGGLGALNLSAGALLVWLVLALAVAFVAPGASFLLTWPLLFALTGLALVFALRLEGGWRQALLLALFAGPGVLLLVPTARNVFVALGVEAHAAVVILLALLLGLLVPQLAPTDGRRRWILPYVAALFGLGFVIAGMFTAVYDRNHPQRNGVLYATDADSGKAVWASLDQRADEWTAQFFGENAERGPMEEYAIYDARGFLRGPAPAVALTPPTVERVGDGTEGDVRRPRLRVTSPRGAQIVTVLVDAGGELLSAEVNGRRLDSEKLSEYMEPGDKFGVNFYAPPAEGVEFSLETKAVQALKVRVCDRSYGLPQAPGVQFRPRPDYMTPSPFQLNDTTSVCKSYSF